MRFFTKIIITLSVLAALAITSSASDFLDRQHDEVWAWVGQMTGADVSSVLTAPVEPEPTEEPNEAETGTEIDPEEATPEEPEETVPEEMESEEITSEDDRWQDPVNARAAQALGGSNEPSWSPGPPDSVVPVEAKGLTEVEPEAEPSFWSRFVTHCKQRWQNLLDRFTFLPFYLIVALVVAIALYLWDRRKDRKE